MEDKDKIYMPHSGLDDKDLKRLRKMEDKPLSDKIFTLNPVIEIEKLTVSDVRLAVRNILDKKRKYLPTGEWVVNVDDIIKEMGKDLI